MSVQTTYSFFSATMGQAGQVDDTSLINVNSFAAEAVIEYGIPVKRGTNHDLQVLPWAENNLNTPVVGISTFSYLGISPTTGIQSNKYEIADTAGVLTTGRILVTVVADVVAGERAYVIAAADATAGKFTNDAAGGDNYLVGTFLSTAADGALAQLELKL